LGSITLHQKISAPTLPSKFLHRTHLLEQLHNSLFTNKNQNYLYFSYKLFLCCAPAGYGKTTLLSDFAHSNPFTCCWYFLDQMDTDPVVFLRTILQSIQRNYPRFGKTLFSKFNNPGPDGIALNQSFYYFLVDEICASIASEIQDPFGLILSNFEEVNESKVITDLVDRFLVKLPPQMVLIIESRIVPALSFTSLVVQDKVNGFNIDSFRFSASEICELANVQELPALSEEEAGQMARFFDGWVAGILLGTRVGQLRLRIFDSQQMQNGISFLHRSNKMLTEHSRKMLFTYVVDAVFKQDPDLITFYQTLSIFQLLEPGICNVILGITDAEERLAYLAQQGLFLSSQESTSGVIYCFHPAIRQLLSDQLQTVDPERFQILHRKAAALWKAAHDEEQALFHALAGKEFDLASSIILEAADSLRQHGQRETVNRWLDALPQAIWENHPQLLVLWATLYLEQGQQMLAIPLLDRVTALIPQELTNGLNDIYAQIAILKSKAFCQLGDYAQAEDLCNQVLLFLPEHEQTLRSAATLRLGICANLQGQFLKGITYLHQARACWANQPPPSQGIEISMALANTYYWMGNLELARYHLHHVLEDCEQIHDISGKGNALILRGLIAQDEGLLSEAEAVFSEVLKISKMALHEQRNQAYALGNLASLALEQGNYLQALDFAHKGLPLARQVGNRSVVNDILASLALGNLFLGDSLSALLYVKQMDVQNDVTKAVGYERAWRDLTFALILLTQHQYEEAVHSLSGLEAALKISNLQRLHFRTKLRLAACRIGLKQSEEAVQLLNEVLSLVNNHPGILHLVRTELKWMPLLHSLVHQHPALETWRNLLHLVDTSENSQEEVLLVEPAQEANSSPRLVITAFGEPQVILDGKPIKHWRMARAMELFFFLLDATTVVSKEALLTALWSEYDEHIANTFRNTIYHLRKLFGEACIALSHAGYQLDLAACYGNQIMYDVQDFFQHQYAAREAVAREEFDRAQEELLKMVQLYKGEYGRSFYNDWCTTRRESLRSAYLEARHQLAQLFWAEEDWNECANHWRAILYLDNCLEAAHYGLMRCYLKLGKRNAALRQYQTYQELLQKELGVQPGQAIQNLYQRLVTKSSAD
jgi:LuxR family transcriptional regulator, maltose regulon positive regulatory protein